MKVAICGVWHVHAGGYTRNAQNFAEVIGVWDSDCKRKNDFAKEHNISTFDTLEELLSSDADAAIVCASTEKHAEILIKLANAGKHIFTEKVLTLTDEDANAVAQAVESNNVSFVISLPWKYRAAIITMKAIADSGELGQINYFRFRNCHSGSVNNWLPTHFYSREECGGGAMIDLGAHGMYLADWFCGTPDTYKSTFTNACTLAETAEKNTDKVEDNAITVMGYKNGCIAVNETGFVSIGYPAILELGGDKGTAIWCNSDTIIKTSRTTEEKSVTIQVDPSAQLPSPLEQFLTGNSLPGCGIEEAKRLTHMMVEAYK